jgi:tetratricopeptide (TPR) repeat protein
LIVRLGFLKIALVSVFVVLGSTAEAQVYDVGSGSSKSPQAPKQAQSSDQSLGWGSNIQNARLARAATLALQHGDKALALDYAERAAKNAPNDPQLWFLLGYAARLNGKLPRAVDAYSHGLRLLPGSLEGQSGLAQTYSMMGRTEEAERLLKQVISADPKRKDDEVLLGELYMRSANYTDALDWLGKAERAQPGARSELLMALSYQRLKQMDQANHYLELARKHAPDNPEVQRSMAGYYRETGNYAEAIAALKSIKNPKPDLIAELAYTYQLSGDLKDSAKLYGQAANAMPKDMNLQLSAAQAEVAVGSIKEANAFLLRAEKIDPKYYRMHAIRGAIARLQERDQDAVREYSTAIANLPPEASEGPLYGIQLHLDLMEVYKNLADDGNARHQLEIAQTQINAVDQNSVGKPQFLRLRAVIKLNAGDTDGALNDVKSALALNPTDRDDLQLNGDILMKIGRTDDAIAVYKQILAIDANNRFALISLGYASRIAGRDQDAEKYFLHLEQVDPSIYVPYLALGDLYAARHDFAKAEESYKKAYTLAPQRALIVAGGMNAAIEAHNIPLAGTWMGRVTDEMNTEPRLLREEERYLSFNGEYQKSAEIAQQAMKVLPKDRDVVVYLGYDLLHLEKYDELASLTAQNLDAFPKDADLPLLQGYVDKHSGQQEKARTDFTEALKRDPNVVTAYVNRGYTLNDLHQPKAAAADFESALKREPNNGEAHLGLAYADLNLRKPQAALRQAELAAKVMGDSKVIHVIRATAYGRQGMLTKAANEYRAALKFDPTDGALYLGLGNTYFAGRHYHDAVDQLQIAAKYAPDNAAVYALLARAYASLQDRTQALQYIQLAEQHAESGPPPTKTSGSSNGSDASASISRAAEDNLGSSISEVYVSTGEALITLGDHRGAMDRFKKAIAVPHSDRVSVRLAIAQLMSQRGETEDAQREIALSLMESEAGDTEPYSGTQYIAAADVFRSMHDYQLSETYLNHAKAAGAPDSAVHIGLANNYLATGDSTRAQGELSAVSVDADSGPDYQYLLAQANLYRQQHHNAQALTSFAQASTAEGEDQTAEQGLLQAGADEGLRVTPVLSLLSDFSVDPIFEDSTVYVLDSKLDAAFPVPSTDTSLLPPPRSSLQTQWLDAFHLHLNHMPVSSGFFQIRNSRGQISVPATNSVVNRNTTDYNFNYGLNPTFNIGRNTVTLDSGVQVTIRRDSESPVALNQNLFRVFTYVSTSSFFDAVSVSGYVIREAGPFTESNVHSRSLSGAIDFRVGAPWGKTALVTGWGASDQQFTPVNYEDYYTSAYAGIEHRFSQKLSLRALAEDLRAWRIVGANSGIAQNLRPAGAINFAPNQSWNFRVSTAYSSTRSFHVYDATQNGFSVTYARPFRRKFNDDTGDVVLEYPIRFTAGFQEETFINFTGAQNQQFRPYVNISLF